MHARLFPILLIFGAFVALPSFAQAPDKDTNLQPGESVSPESAEQVRSRTLTKELAQEGENELNKAVRVFQQRYLTKRHRLELQLGGALTANDPWVKHYSADAGLFFHFTENFAFGVSASKYYGFDSQTLTSVETNFGLFPEKSHLQAGGMAEVQWAPLFGKFSVFGIGVVQVDAYLIAGGGAVRTTRGTAYKPAGEVGAGMRLHLLRWLSISADLRDVFDLETFQDCDASSAGVCGKYFVQNLFAGLRIGIWIPPVSTYRFPR